MDYPTVDRQPKIHQIQASAVINDKYCYPSRGLKDIVCSPCAVATHIGAILPPCQRLTLGMRPLQVCEFAAEESINSLRITLHHCQI